MLDLYSGAGIGHHRPHRIAVATPTPNRGAVCRADDPASTVSSTRPRRSLEQAPLIFRPFVVWDEESHLNRRFGIPSVNLNSRMTLQSFIRPDGIRPEANSLCFYAISESPNEFIWLEIAPGSTINAQTLSTRESNHQTFTQIPRQRVRSITGRMPPECARDSEDRVL